jgi:hypothetical protein
LAYSADGISWTEITGTANPFTNTITNITYANGKFIANDNYGYMATSTNGVTWTDVPNHGIFESRLSSNIIYDIAYGAGKLVAVGVGRTGATTGAPIIAYCND